LGGGDLVGVTLPPRLAGLALIGAALLGGCSSGPGAEYLEAASAVAPARYDTEAELVNAGRASCLQQSDGKTPAQISEAVVFWAGYAGGQVDRAEASRLVEVALQHCGYLLGPDAARLVEGA
jgi:hypothetical protein